MGKNILLIGFFLLGTLGLSAQIQEGDDGLYYNDQGELYTGIVKTFYEEGPMLSKMVLIDGMREGYVLVYHKNGNLSEVRSYKHNKKDGTWAMFTPDNRKVAEANYREDEKHGKWYVWSPDGTLLYDMKYVNNHPKGMWKIFNAEGKLTAKRKFEGTYAGLEDRMIVQK